jgi:hypothetical protein
MMTAPFSHNRCTVSGAGTVRISGWWLLLKRWPEGEGGGCGIPMSFPPWSVVGMHI